jgi:translation initiation factor 3 subunit M
MRVVRSTSSFESIRLHLDSLEGWVSTWGVPDKEKPSLYNEVSEIAKDAGEDDISYQYQLKALRTFTSETASSPEARKTALSSLKVALDAPSHYDFQDLTALDAIQALRKSDAIYFELLELFTSETLDEFNDFKDEHDGWIEKEGLNKQALDRKMRLLTLATLAASSGQARSLPYANIAKALQIPEDDVEMWVIDVIRAGLVEGKLSQLNKTFLIHRSTYRVFGDNQWREIAARLDMWKTSLTGVLAVVRQEKDNFTAAKEQEKKEADTKLNGATQTQGGGGGGYRNRQQRQQEVETE